MPITTHPIARDTFTVDASTLLPTRADLVVRLDERVRSADDQPATLVLVGLLRRDDGWPIPGSVLGQLTSVLASSVRGDDWIARSGPTEFAVVFDGSAEAAEAAATRLIAAISAQGIAGMSAAAGLAGLTVDITGSEVHRRATLCLAAARSVGGGQVIKYSGTR
ncbi:GGDEF domain-containing protein [Modestobacter sp. NPDC049651]|uniref:GGDEF domain-containing protein n=1 Tax=unclassified Modestobacter TaxID=2643866 RepID=UPI0033E518D2